MAITELTCHVVPRSGSQISFHRRNGLRIPEASATVYVGCLRVKADAGITGQAVAVV